MMRLNSGFSFVRNCNMPTSQKSPRPTPQKRKAESNLLKVGVKLVKTFTDDDSSANYEGTIVKVGQGPSGATLFEVLYSDGDEETMSLAEVQRWRKMNLKPTPAYAPSDTAAAPHRAAVRGGGGASAAGTTSSTHAANLVPQPSSGGGGGGGEDGNGGGGSGSCNIALPACALAALYLAANAHGGEPLHVMAALKVLPIYALVVVVHKRGRVSGGGSRAWASTHAKATALGLCLSSLGDVLLEVEPAGGEPCFLGGLGAFLVAHWLYIWGLTAGPASGSGGGAFGAGAAAYALAAALLEVLRRSEGGLPSDLLAPVAVYAFSIATMLWCAARRFSSEIHGKASGPSRAHALWGAASFVVSDSVLAYNKFAAPVPRAKAIVMVTYYAAQVLIALSADGTH